MMKSIKFSKIIKFLILITLFFPFSNCNILESLTSEVKQEAPDFFGKHSLELREDISKTTQATAIIEEAIRGSKYEKLVKMRSPPSKLGGVTSDKIEKPLREKTLEVLPDLEKVEIRHKVEIFLVSNELGSINISQQEKDYWEKFLEDMDNEE